MTGASARACGFDGCRNTVHSGYYCITHYTHRRLYGEMHPINYIRPGGICVEPDCGLPHKARGLCKKHYQRAQDRLEFPSRRCAQDICEQRAKKRGLCATHYAQARRRGEFDGPACSVPDCGVYASRSGRCDRHGKRGYLYGLSDDEMARIDAGIACEICSDVLATHVDHCHQSGVVRGYLCAQCNTAIGLLRDSPRILIAAAGYLERSVRGVA